MLRLGIVGLPNVGKSTLFNALTEAGVLVANYPFATREPNTGVVSVPDARLEGLARLAHRQRRVPATVKFVDIAGLVKGASHGEGLGNQFLANIRDVDAIVHVVCCFDDPDVSHVMGSVDPLRDREIINIELALADLGTVERRLEKVARTVKSGDPKARVEKALLERLRQALADGRPARGIAPGDDERDIYRSLNLLTSKPMLYAVNVQENEMASGSAHVEALRAAIGKDAEPAQLVTFSGKVEAELCELTAEERREFLASMGVEESGLDRLVRAAYQLLGLLSFFTIGDEEVRAWTLHRGDRASTAAGIIHTDFERGFIRAETIGYEELVRAGGWKNAREQGRVRSEGRDYIVQDGDVILFRFNV